MRLLYVYSRWYEKHDKPQSVMIIVIPFLFAVEFISIPFVGTPTIASNLAFVSGQMKLKYYHLGPAMIYVLLFCGIENELSLL